MAMEYGCLNAVPEADSESLFGFFCQRVLSGPVIWLGASTIFTL